MSDKAMDNRDKVMKLVAAFPDEERRKRCTEMLEGLVGVEYFSSPASSREQFHDCYPGGLAQHSLNVVMNLHRLANDLCPSEFPKHVLNFVGLFHDLGKVGDGSNPRYVPNPNVGGRNRGYLYEINDSMTWMTTADAGLYILQNHGITCSLQEYLAIKLNDGQYVEENKTYRMREPKLALLLHWADLWDAHSKKPI